MQVCGDNLLLIGTLYRGFGMRWVIERSKLCLDHSCTLYGIYALACALYGGIWSVVNIPVIGLLSLCCVITTQVGRYSCQQIELLPIPLGMSGGAAAAVAAISVSATTTSIYNKRIRAYLPVVTGTIAKVINFFKRDAAPPASEIIPLQPLSLLSMTPKS